MVKNLSESIPYLFGWYEGERDARIMTENKPNENGYTLDVYHQIKENLLACVYNFAPNDYQRGYADAFDFVSLEKNPDWINGVPEEYDINDYI